MTLSPMLLGPSIGMRIWRHQPGTVVHTYSLSYLDGCGGRVTRVHRLEANTAKPIAKTKYIKILDVPKEAREKAGITGVGKARSVQQWAFHLYSKGITQLGLVQTGLTLLSPEMGPATPRSRRDKSKKYLSWESCQPHSGDQSDHCGPGCFPRC